MNAQDILELTLYQKWNSTVEVRNVLHYRVSSVGTADESGLSIAFNLTVLPKMLDVQHSTLEHYRQTVLNLSDNLGWADIDLIPDQGGVLLGEAMPPFVAYAFRKNRATRSTRSGQLRVAGLPEGVQNFGLAESSIMDDLDELATALGQAISDGTGGLYIPVIVRKTAEGALGSWNAIDNFEFTAISSQNSRKYGRGQ